MARSIWNMHGHQVGLTHGYWSGRARITVDDEVVFERPINVVDYGFVHRFEIDEIPVAVRVITNGATFRHEFLSGADAEMVEETNELPLERPLTGMAILLSVVAFVTVCLFGIGIVVVLVLKG